MILSLHFELAEFLVSETAARLGISNEPSDEVIVNLRRLCSEVLEPLRESLARPVIITSGYRSAELNHAIGGSFTSHHMIGRAADIIVPGLPPIEVCRHIQLLDLPCSQIIHEFGRWTHVSVADGHSEQQVFTARHEFGATIYQRGLHHV